MAPRLIYLMFSKLLGWMVSERGVSFRPALTAPTGWADHSTSISMATRETCVEFLPPTGSRFEQGGVVDAPGLTDERDGRRLLGLLADEHRTVARERPVEDVGLDGEQRGRT